MRSWFIRTLMLVCLAMPFAGQTNEWHRYSNQDGNFSVLMPVDPTDTVNGDPSEQVSHTVQAISGSIGYTVVYVINKTEQPVDQATFNIYRDAFLKGLPNCERVTEEAASPAVRGYIGGWYRVNCDVNGTKMSFAGNLYWGKRYAYAVLTMFPTAPSEPATARKFTSSFSVLDASK